MSLGSLAMRTSYFASSSFTSEYAVRDRHLNSDVRKNSEVLRSPRPPFARSQRYRNKQEGARQAARGESGNLREEQANQRPCWQPCAHHNLLHTPPRATLFRHQVGAIDLNRLQAVRVNRPYLAPA
jgi:hypothetical protein